MTNDEARTAWDVLNADRRVEVLHRIGCREIYECRDLNFEALPQETRDALAYWGMA